MRAELEGCLKELQEAILKYESTEGTQNLEKEGDALEYFNELADKAQKCWELSKTSGLTQQERLEFLNAFKNELKFKKQHN